jgi:hypothetical protein
VVAADGEQPRRGETSRIYFGQPGDYTFFAPSPATAAGEQGVIPVTDPPITLEQAEATAKRQ